MDGSIMNNSNRKHILQDTKLWQWCWQSLKCSVM